MKLCLIGAGAIGGLLLAHVPDPASTTVVARNTALRAMRERGVMELLSDGSGAGVRRCRPLLVSVEAAQELEPQDIVLVAVKGPALPQLAPLLALLARQGALIVFAMNGLPWWIVQQAGPVAAPLLEQRDPDGSLRAIGLQASAHALVYAGAQAEAPGVVRNTTPGRNRIVLGQAAHPADPRLQWLVDNFTAQGLPATLAHDLRTELWSKLLATVSLAPLGALLDATNRALCADPPVRALAERMMHEALAIGAALGITPDVEVAARLDPARHSEHLSSLAQDFAAGRPVELDDGILALCALARALDCAAPSLEAVGAALAFRANRLGLRPAGH